MGVRIEIKAFEKIPEQLIGHTLMGVRIEINVPFWNLESDWRHTIMGVRIEIGSVIGALVVFVSHPYGCAD